MKKRSKAEVEQFVTNLVNGIVADIMEDFPTVKKAVQKIPLNRWGEFLDGKFETATDNAMTYFGVTDE